MEKKTTVIGIVGCGAMGSGIAQVAGSAGHQVLVYDSNKTALEKAAENLKNTLHKLVEKLKLSQEDADNIIANITFVDNLNRFVDCALVIEAIVENLDVKKSVFAALEKVVDKQCILASNTSSLSVTSIASACSRPARVLGIHFFNPAAIMPLVEIIPGIATDPENVTLSKTLIDSWGKTTVIAKDTPGFIVNRVARPFYSEALRIFEEGIADMATIDWAMKELGGFKMGPFELMDLIGHDVNYIVTETVWKEFYYDPKFKPALTQKRLVEAGFFGRKSGRGFYSYAAGDTLPLPDKNKTHGELILKRILAMLINEAADTLYLGIASKQDIDLAMTKGVNYPKGLLKWADEVGLSTVVEQLNELKDLYEEDRYRISPILKKMLKSGQTFY